MEVARIDKWLWAARIFKTRSIAADACKNGRVMLGGVTVKPSRTVKVGDVVSVKKPPVTYSFKVLKTIEQRVGAKLLPEIYENAHAALAARLRRSAERWMRSPSLPCSVSTTSTTILISTNSVSQRIIIVLPRIQRLVLTAD